MDLKTLEECKNTTPSSSENNNVYSLEGYNYLMNKSKNLDFGDDVYSTITKLCPTAILNKDVYAGNTFVTKMINQDHLYLSNKGTTNGKTFPVNGDKYAYLDTDLIIYGTVTLSTVYYVDIYCNGKLIDRINKNNETIILGSKKSINVKSQMFYKTDSYLLIHTHKLFEPNKTYTVKTTGISGTNVPSSWSFTTIERKPMGNYINVSKGDYDGDFQTLQSALDYLKDKTGSYSISLIGDWSTYHELIRDESKATITINGGGKTIQFDNCGTINLQEDERSVFECAGGDIILNNLNIKNTYSRAKYRKYTFTKEA